ncbi:MAG: hypothetical protein HYU64_21010, partial [Armatimonadetes bacterium]|nr:hypothetical protein [Armatimonadota bacterium]
MTKTITLIGIILLLLTAGLPAAPANKSPQPLSLTIDGKSFAGSVFQKGTEIFASLPEFLQASGLTRGDLDKLNLPNNGYAVSKRLPHVS